jgi:hypothetical protein
MGRQPGSDFVNMTMDERLYNILFKKTVAAAPVTFIFSSLSHSLKRPLLEI